MCNSHPSTNSKSYKIKLSLKTKFNAGIDVFSKKTQYVLKISYPVATSLPSKI